MEIKDCENKRELKYEEYAGFFNCPVCRRGECPYEIGIRVDWEGEDDFMLCKTNGEIYSSE